MGHSKVALRTCKTSYAEPLAIHGETKQKLGAVFTTATSGRQLGILAIPIDSSRLSVRSNRSIAADPVICDFQCSRGQEKSEIIDEVGSMGLGSAEEMCGCLLSEIALRTSGPALAECDQGSVEMLAMRSAFPG